MPRRICDVCGKEKDARGGKVCANEHFICADCVYGGFFGPPYIRNDLAHCNMNKLDAKLKISRNYAQKMSSIVVHLVEFFINNIFY